jgi:hypothetical protein
VPWFDYVDRVISQLESVPGVVLPDNRPDLLFPILTNTQVLLATEVMPPKHHQPSENLPPANSNLDTDLVDSNLPPNAATAALPSSVAAPLITAMDLPSLQVDGLVPLGIIVESSTSPLVGKRKVNSLGVLQRSLHTAATTDVEETMEEPPHKRQSQSHNSDDVKTQHSSQKLVVDITGQVDLPGNAPFRQKFAFYQPSFAASQDTTDPKKLVLYCGTNHTQPGNVVYLDV